MTEIVVNISQQDDGSKTLFNVSSISIEYYNLLPKDQIIPGVTLLRRDDPTAKAQHINDRMRAGEVALSIPDPINPHETIELIIAQAEATEIMVGDDEATAVPVTMLKLLCNLTLPTYDKLLMGGQISFIKQVE